MAPAIKVRSPKKKAPYLAQIDPRDLLAHPKNLRTQLGDLTELRASIAAYGVWQALTVIPEDDGYRVVAGHRRAAAAKEALKAGEWPEGLSPTVPCLVRPDLVGLAPEQIVAMLVENDQRVDLTESERAAGYAQLELFGLDVAEIARRTGRPTQHVQSALKLTKLGAAATAAADAGRLSLEDVAELAEFEDDPKTMEKILKDVGSSWGIKHKVQEERRKRQVKEAVAAVTAELEAAGVKIVKRPKEWPYNCQMARVDQLETADGEKIDPEAVKTLDGYAAVIEERWDSAGSFVVCLDPEAHGYKRTGHSYYKSPAEIAAKEAADKAKEDLRARLKESAAVRRRFLVEKYGSAKGAKTLLVDAMRFAVVWPDFLQYRVDGELIKELAGGVLTDGLTAGQDRLNRLLVARLIGAQEHNVEQVADGRWVAHKDLIVLWLNRLEEDGYELSEAEADMRAALIAAEEERKRAEAEEEAEELAYEAELAAEEADGDEGDGDQEVVDVQLPEEDVDPGPCAEADLAPNDAEQPENQGDE
ncbi:chromosome partitioning protein, ParB family [Micromonospora echinofusca]|uniref:Chromosome partitioning protein, ParB family n=1 Tax=Micromonospora echinofusca TaxID=47858 RepID=A0A1C5G7E9_MICEH|nr:ParB N-terminal domain-containing protein [Micromonospora echinofusca]SCG15492.1 chromosome partitioning protein, ParB family [Micromonospora echinofusca]